MFDELDVEAWRQELTVGRAQHAAELITKLAALRQGSSVIDFGCGSGAVAHALAYRGISVCGIDRSEAAIMEARAGAPALCSFEQADWLEVSLERSFDCALFWYTTLCAGAERDMSALRMARKQLNTGGVLLLETRNWDRQPRQFDSRSERAGANFVLTERHAYDPTSGVQTTEQTFTFVDRAISRVYQTRRYSYLELRAMCLEAGFGQVAAFDQTSAELSNESERLILRARADGGPR